MFYVEFSFVSGRKLRHWVHMQSIWEQEEEAKKVPYLAEENRGCDVALDGLFEHFDSDIIHVELCSVVGVPAVV